MPRSYPTVRALVLLLLVAPASARADGFRVSLTEGLRYTSANGELELHAGGVYAGDLVLHESQNATSSGLRTDLAKPIVEGSFRGAWFARISGDLEGTKTPSNLYEAFVAWQGVPWLRVSAGLLQLPLGFEAGTRPEDLALVGHSFSYYMDYRTDWALRVEGELAEGVFDWDVAYLIGDGFDANGKPQRGAQAQARVWLNPLRSLRGPDAGFLASVAGGFFLCGGYAYTNDWHGRLRIRNPAGTRLFDTSSFDADWRQFYTLSFGFEVGPVRLYYEGTQGGYFDAETPVGTRDLDNQTDSWQATLSWRITGEPYDGRIFHERALTPLGPNAWEIALRYANGDIDRDFFDFGLADSSSSSQEFRTTTLALHWYATPNVRLSAEYVRTQADDDIATLGFDGDDSAGIVRVELRF
ncbi:MAG: porin [Myxococcota bacterium]